jgi:hypothetical protein
MKIRLTAAGVLNLPAKPAAAALRRDFEARHFVLLRNFLEGPLLAQALAVLKATRFKARKTPKDLFAVESSESHGADYLLTFLMQDPRFFEFVEAVTGCAPIRSFAGSVIRSRPGRGHFINWHSDVDYDPLRLASISLNLSSPPFRGGLLQFRRRGQERAASEIANTGLGDAVLFKAGGGIEHRNTPVTGTSPKTAFAGWFYSDRKGGTDSAFSRGLRGLRSTPAAKVSLRPQGVAGPSASRAAAEFASTPRSRRRD